ncbi:hypothetical protein TI03_01960 [Achromatium sp. WMS1]|nr:hypothetical protein TI03_01960 [Achromatium sp. WMS1]
MFSFLPKIFTTPTPILSCQIQATSLIGRREENQDNYLIINANNTEKTVATWLKNGNPQQAVCSNWPTHLIRVVLMDGMGGHTKGREITEVAALKLSKIPPCITVNKQQQALLRLHHVLRNSFTGAKQTRQPGTSILWAEIDLARCVGTLIHVGDSRAWLYNNHKWQQLTWDHTALEFDFRDGRIDETSYWQKLKKPQHRIAQAFGYGSWGVMWQDKDGNDIMGLGSGLRLDTEKTLPPYAQDHTDIFNFTLSPQTSLLLASDGLWDATQVNLPEPAEITANTSKKLAQDAIDAGGRDNTSVVIANFTPRTAEEKM